LRWRRLLLCPLLLRWHGLLRWHRLLLLQDWSVLRRHRRSAVE